MQKYRIIYLAEALKELDAVSERHFELVGINSSINIVRKIQEDIRHLEYVPYIGKPLSEPRLADRKLMVLISGNYLCFYRIEGEIIYIHHIIDGRTDYIKRLLYSKL
ncbi:MAG: type II toxin-antitoxin system RelE/ParE family toxin [Ruminiclostridium sp.]|nr:type II toxin-antitoxin system RelE/ParE family toxin [Ruminiclostridium sp.]